MMFVCALARRVALPLPLPLALPLTFPLVCPTRIVSQRRFSTSSASRGSYQPSAPLQPSAGQIVAQTPLALESFFAQHRPLVLVDEPKFLRASQSTEKSSPESEFSDIVKYNDEFSNIFSSFRPFSPPVSSPLSGKATYKRISTRDRSKPTSPTSTSSTRSPLSDSSSSLSSPASTTTQSQSLQTIELNLSALPALRGRKSPYTELYVDMQPQLDDSNDKTVWAITIKKRRRQKINKHKFKKLRKRTRFERAKNRK